MFGKILVKNELTNVFDFLLRPENPIQFLGKFLLDHDPERKK